MLRGHLQTETGSGLVRWVRTGRMVPKRTVEVREHVRRETAWKTKTNDEHRSVRLWTGPHWVRIDRLPRLLVAVNARRRWIAEWSPWGP